MLFSKRLELAKKIDDYMEEKHIIRSTLGVVSVLQMWKMLAIPIEPQVGIANGGHPEDYCEKCKQPNVTWFIQSDLWNKYSNGHDIICPICFIKQAEASGYKPTSWELKPE